MNKYLVIACLLLISVTGFLYNKVERQKKEIERLDTNIEAINSEAVRFKTKAGKDAETVQALTLKRDELELFNSRLTKQVSDLRIKLRDVKAAHTIETELRIDTVVITEKTDVQNQYKFKYADNWNEITGVVSPDSTKLEFNSVDTLDVISHVKQKRFLFFRIGKPKIRTTITNQNPKSTIHVRFSAEL
ncbi:hypothetical protein SJC20_21 [Bacteroides phage SJC20]|nr:hypothetical protein SJC20_21 [Bacteroides phage SJC20]